MPFPGLWGKIWQKSEGQKRHYNVSKKIVSWGPWPPGPPCQHAADRCVCGVIFIRFLLPDFYRTTSNPFNILAWRTRQHTTTHDNTRQHFSRPTKIVSCAPGFKAVFHCKRIVAVPNIFFCVNIISSSAHGTKKYATFRYDTGEVENRLYTGEVNCKSWLEWDLNLWEWIWSLDLSMKLFL